MSKIKDALILLLFLPLIVLGIIFNGPPAYEDWKRGQRNG
jgi:hypothetical protein